MAFQLRDYQEDIANRAAAILEERGIVILAMEVRTGKTHTAFATCERLKDCRRVLFITKKKPIDSGTIKADYDAVKNRGYTLTLINFESVHKLTYKHYDCIIVDEFHSLGAFPKPSKRAREIKNIFNTCHPKYHIMLSGTPSPESFSQFFHPFWVNSQNSPFEHSTFYKWAHEFVNVKKKFVAHGNQVNDYSEGIEEKIMEVIQPMILTYTQEQAGFTTKAKDVIHTVEMEPRTYQLVSMLKRDLVVVSKSGKEILADTPVKLMQKCHQLYSGTVKDEDGHSIILDKSKAEYIWGYFGGHKLAIFYKYKAELDMILEHIPGTTTDIDAFNNDPDLNIALQVVAGREGISLKAADYLIMFNIDFSNVSYIQARNRLATLDRAENEVHWIFSKGGLEHDIYDVVRNKEEKYNKSHFNRFAKSIYDGRN